MSMAASDDYFFSPLSAEHRGPSTSVQGPQETLGPALGLSSLPSLRSY